MRIWTSTLLLLWISGTASAQQPSHDDLENLEHVIKHTKPAPGLEAAPTGAPRWCTPSFKPAEDYPAYNMASAFTAIYGSNDETTDNFLIRIAAGACALPNEPGYQHAVTEVTQLWINASGMTAADAVASLGARVDIARWSAEHDALCKSDELAPGSGDDTEEPHAMRSARYALFNCSSSDGMWMDWRQRPPTPLTAMEPFLDRGAMERDHDEIVHLAYVLGQLAYILDPNADKKETRLANYAVFQYDLKTLDFAAALKQLDAPPYRGNRFAKIVVIETIAKVKREIAELEAQVAKHTTDDKWKELLVKVPKGAIAGWSAAATKDAALLSYIDTLQPTVKSGCAAGSPEARRALCGKSGGMAKAQKAVTGCEAKLRDALKPILKRQPHSSEVEFEENLSQEKLAGLILTSLAGCVAVEGDLHAAEELRGLSHRVRYIKGPRAAAYFASVDAIKALGDEAPYGAGNLQRIAGKANAPRKPGGYLNAGTIKSVTPAGDGKLKVVFVTVKETRDERVCDERRLEWVTTPYAIVPVYHPVCHLTGNKIQVKTSPGPITVSAACTAGVAPGRFAIITDWTTSSVRTGRDGVVSLAAVVTDKSKTANVLADACLAIP